MTAMVAARATTALCLVVSVPGHYLCDDAFNKKPTLSRQEIIPRSDLYQNTVGLVLLLVVHY
mgnify:CR=1 FL=1